MENNMKGTKKDSSVIAQHYDDGFYCKYVCVSFLIFNLNVASKIRTTIWFGLILVALLDKFLFSFVRCDYRYLIANIYILFVYGVCMYLFLFSTHKAFICAQNTEISNSSSYMVTIMFLGYWTNLQLDFRDSPGMLLWL